jgi:competence protein ComEC
MACLAGQRWTWDDVRFTVLHPTRAEYDDARAKTNDRSCVVRIESAYGTALLTGDLEAARLAWLREMVDGDMWFESGAVKRFVRTIAPTRRAVGVFHCAPGAEAQVDFFRGAPTLDARYDAASVRTMRTDLDGAITLSFAPQTPLLPVAAREQRRRYWMDAPTQAPTDPEPASAE